MLNRFIVRLSFQLLQKASYQTKPSTPSHLRIGLCQILVQKEKEENIKNAAALIDQTKDPNLVVSIFTSYL